MVSRAVVIIGDYSSSPKDYAKLKRTLQQPPYNYIVICVPIRLWQWLIYWNRRPAPLLRQIERAVNKLRRQYDVDQVILIGHGAGGILARLYLGDHEIAGKVYNGQRFVSHLITLGTEHQPQGRKPGRFVRFANEHYPGAYYKHILYRTVGSRDVQGNPKGSVRERIAWRAYRKQAVWGDGLVPEAATRLEGARHQTLYNIGHSPVHHARWYGSPAALELWDHLLAGNLALSGSK